MARPEERPTLRLVGGPADADDGGPRPICGPARPAPSARPAPAVAAAAPAPLAAHDPRWVLAVHVEYQLQGTVLTPDRRARILRLARQLDVRPFEANLVMAIVQDHARCGRSLADAQPVLALLNRPAPRATARWPRLTAAFLCALTATGLMIWWLVGSS